MENSNLRLQTTLSFYEDTPSQITSNLFIGNLSCSQNKDKLKLLGVTHILRVADRIKDSFPDDFIYLTISIPDRCESLLYPYFDVLFHFIESCIKNQDKLMIHCAWGISRSVTLMASYIMRKMNIPYYLAIEFIRKQRPIASPNSGFVYQLREYYLKFVAKVIKIDNKHSFANHCSMFHKQKLSRNRVHFIFTDPISKKKNILKLNSKKIRRDKMSLEMKKVKLFSLLEEKIINLGESSREEKLKCLNMSLKFRETALKFLFQDRTKRSVTVANQFKKKIMNLMMRCGKLFISLLLQ
jgi:dual specificity protein phosphatase 1B